MKKIFFLLCLCAALINANDEDNEEYIKEGNLALPTSQQPSPLFGFGQNMVDKNDFQVFLDFDRISGQTRQSNELIFSALYGITNSLSIFGVIPIGTKICNNKFCSAGLEDIFLQAEYAYYTKSGHDYLNQATIVGNIRFPSGSSKKNPPTGFGSTSFFIGTTASHQATDWYYWISPGIILTTEKNNTKFGNTFLYQLGIGRNLTYSSSRCLLTFMVELFGIFTQRDKLKRITNPNSGGNIFFVGPSLWFATQKFVIQTGIALPIAQHLNGAQSDVDYFFALDLRWKF